MPDDWVAIVRRVVTPVSIKCLDKSEHNFYVSHYRTQRNQSTFTGLLISRKTLAGPAVPLNEAASDWPEEHKRKALGKR